jgi:hypothetical protein
VERAADQSSPSNADVKNASSPYQPRFSIVLSFATAIFGFIQ